MSELFSECNKIEIIDLFNFNSKNVKLMSKMFNKSRN